MTVATITGRPVRLARGTSRVSGVWAATMLVTAAAAWLIWVGWSELASAHVLGRSIRAGEGQMVGPILLAVVAAMFVAERFWPAARRPATARAHLVDAAYLGLYALIAPAVMALNTGFAVEVGRHAPFLIVGKLPLVPEVAVTGFILAGIDAMNWAAHVGNHRLPWLWRFHALHHSQEEMSVFTTFRTHPLTHAAYLPAVVPAVLLATSGTVPTVALIVYGSLVAVSHSNVKWSYGPLGRVLVSPAFHRLHHSSAEVMGKRTVNFGFALSVWDRIARTAVLPTGPAVVQTGLAGRPVPVEQATPGIARVVAAQLVQPFRLRSGLEDRT